MKAPEMIKKSEKELQELLGNWRQELATLHRERFIADAKNVHTSKLIRKNIARTLTVLNQLRSSATEQSKSTKVTTGKGA
jgi:ribosomal protein L29